MSVERKYKETSMLPKERNQVGIIALIAMFRMFGLFALLPVLSIYASNLKHATPILIGLSVGAYGLTQAIFQIPFGLMSDRIGRKPVICIGLIIFILGSLVAANSETIYGVVFGRLLQGVGAISSSLSALLTDLTRKEIRTKSMAILGVGIGGSFLLSLMFGPIISSYFGVRSLFFISAIVSLIAMSLLVLIPSGARRLNSDIQRNLRNVFKLNLLVNHLHIYFLHLILTMMFVVVPFIITKELNIPLIDHWKIYISSLLASLVFAIPLILSDDKEKEKKSLFLPVALLLISQLMLVIFGDSMILVIISLIVFFTGFNYMEASLPARISIMADEELRGASLGVFSSFQFLGAFSGGILGGWLIGMFAPKDAIIFSVLLIILWLVFAIFFKRS
ncbi:MAG TPA: MFS transporter [Woeseiaceae bacterium]|nr:MFS transporter [Woeseiaceae bacterium]|tara:strand:+ start:1322 stop:2497 length:1176 start_codon:yes stop_codon:yes gene_type:complete